jgi:hypothetical protein
MFEMPLILKGSKYRYSTQRNQAGWRSVLLTERFVFKRMAAKMRKYNNAAA